MPRRKPDAQTLLETRQDASRAVATLLASAARRHRGSSIKALTLAAQVRHKRATHAVTCETIRHVRAIKTLFVDVGDPLEALTRDPEGSSSGREGDRAWRARAEAYAYAYDLLFGSARHLEKWEGEAGGCAMVRDHARALTEALERAMRREKVSKASEYAAKVSGASFAGVQYSRTARVNTLKMGVEDAMRVFRDGGFECAVDGLIDTLLVFPAGTDLHAHELVKNGAVVLQGRASCLPAAALAPKRGWACIDGCAAPGNKTTQLAAMVGREGGVFAFDADARRLKRLKENAATTGSNNIIRAKCQDFLTVDPEDKMYASVRALLLDPSCSGSGTEVNRGDILLRNALGADEDEDDVAEEDEARIDKLAAFQKSVLKHAFEFPEVERVSYSTCSVHEKENEEVVRDVMEAARAKGFKLFHALPKWHRRGVRIEGLSESDAQCVIRADPMEDDMEGFFVAIFERDVSLTRSKGENLIPSNPNAAASAAATKKRPKVDPDSVKPVYGGGKKKKSKGGGRAPLFR